VGTSFATIAHCLEPNIFSLFGLYENKHGMKREVVFLAHRSMHINLLCKMHKFLKISKNYVLLLGGRIFRIFATYSGDWLHFCFYNRSVVCYNSTKPVLHWLR
jgi:hypothetical protein